VAVDLLSALRDHLIGQGIVRKPSIAGSPPPLWLEPQQGVKEPGTGDPPETDPELHLGAFLTGGIAPRRFESWWRQPILDIRFRGKGRLAVQRIQETELAISKALIDRVDWTMSGLYVVECEQWRPLQRLGSDEQGYEYVASYRFQLYRP
jgi:hypothetical protein